jgi:glutathione S-transferase
MKEPAHRRLHPFGQIPTYEDGDLMLFESGAIVFHIAECHPGLLPDDANARARAIAWMFAALSTVEPPIVERGAATLTERDKTWYATRLPILDDRVRARLADLSIRLGDADWLDGRFSAGDLLMVTVLRRLNGSGLLEDYRTSAPISPAAKRGPPTSAPSPINWRSSPASHRPANKSPLWAYSSLSWSDLWTAAMDRKRDRCPQIDLALGNQNAGQRAGERIVTDMATCGLYSFGAPAYRS